jgi:hypothetical protein
MAKSKKRYSDKAGELVESAMRRRKRGTLRSSSGARVTSRKQAIAIGLSEAREKGARVPRESSSRKSASSGGRTKTASRKRATGRRKTTSGSTAATGRKKSTGRKK